MMEEIERYQDGDSDLPTGIDSVPHWSSTARGLGIVASTLYVVVGCHVYLLKD